MQNDKGEQVCVSLIPNYGVCTRPQSHPIHQPLGVSPLEHSYEREKSGVVEEVRLSRRNIKTIAKRSGQHPQELERMRKLAKLQKRTLVLKYDVLPEVIKAEKEAAGESS